MILILKASGKINSILFAQRSYLNMLIWKKYWEYLGFVLKRKNTHIVLNFRKKNLHRYKTEFANLEKLTSIIKLVDFQEKNGCQFQLKIESRYITKLQKITTASAMPGTTNAKPVRKIRSSSSLV